MIFHQRIGCFLVYCFCALGCDPMDVSSAGKISLGESVDPAGFKYLCVVTVEESEFDSDAVVDVNTTTTSELKIDLAEISFPYDYKTDASIGVSKSIPFRAVAWLDKSAGDPARNEFQLDPQEVYGITTFKSKSCDWPSGDGDRCGQTAGVDIVLEHVKSESASEI